MPRTGRPPYKYNPELVAKAREYLENPLPPDEVVHSIEGLSLYINVSRQAIYDWISQEGKDDFVDIVSRILAKQGKKLLNRGLDSTFNSKIAAVMLSKHGYREGHEVTGADGKDLFTPTADEKLAAEKALKQIGA